MTIYQIYVAVDVKITRDVLDRILIQSDEIVATKVRIGNYNQSIINNNIVEVSL